MVRRKQTAPISPQQLRHFAVAGVAVTGLLAMFASGEDWGTPAEFEATEAKNRLAATEAEKLGPTRLEDKLKVRRDTSQSMSMNDPPVLSGGDSGGGGGGGSRRAYAAPGASTGRGATVNISQLPPGSPAFEKAMQEQSKKTARPAELSEDDRSRLEAASRMRSGSAETED